MSMFSWVLLSSLVSSKILTDFGKINVVEFAHFASFIQMKNKGVRVIIILCSQNFRTQYKML